MEVRPPRTFFGVGGRNRCRRSVGRDLVDNERVEVAAGRAGAWQAICSLERTHDFLRFAPGRRLASAVILGSRFRARRYPIPASPIGGVPISQIKPRSATPRGGAMRRIAVIIGVVTAFLMPLTAREALADPDACTKLGGEVVGAGLATECQLSDSVKKSGV